MSLEFFNNPKCFILSVTDRMNLEEYRRHGKQIYIHKRKIENNENL